MNSELLSIKEQLQQNEPLNFAAVEKAWRNRAALETDGNYVMALLDVLRDAINVNPGHISEIVATISSVISDSKSRFSVADMVNLKDSIEALKPAVLEGSENYRGINSLVQLLAQKRTIN